MDMSGVMRRGRSGRRLGVLTLGGAVLEDIGAWNAIEGDHAPAMIGGEALCRPPLAEGHRLGARHAARLAAPDHVPGGARLDPAAALRRRPNPLPHVVNIDGADVLGFFG